MMIDPHTLIQTITLALGFYMAWNIGANDVANAMGTSVGSKALTLKKAVLLAAVLEFSGAYFAGSEVSETIQKGIIDPAIFQADPMIFVIGMMGALLATGVGLQLASYLGLPVSTTHAIVGAVLGFGFFLGGSSAVNWHEMGWIASSWIISPLISGILSYSIFSLIQKKILFALDPMEATKKLAPYFVFASCFLVAWLLSFQTTLSSPLIASTASIAGLGGFGICKLIIDRTTIAPLQTADGFNPYQTVSLEKAMHHLQRAHLSNLDNTYAPQISSVLNQLQRLTDTARRNTSFLHSSAQYQGVEKIFVSLQILSACLIAFAHGANDVANAIGPVAAVISVLKNKSVALEATIPSWLLLLGGAGIVIGLATWGWRVIETIGKKITELTPTRGFAAEFSAAITILFASKLGLPISTTHALIGAIFGVGMARGLKALNLQTLKEIILSWLITIPFCATLSILAFYLLQLLLIRANL